MLNSEITVTSMQEYIAVIDEFNLGNDYILFRGQTHNWLPKPNIQRLKKRLVNVEESSLTLAGVEQECLKVFKLRATPHIQDFYPENDWHWISLAQHHRLVTRLLDWTINPLVALWFATQPGDPVKKLMPIVYVYEPKDSDFVTQEEFDKSPFALNQSVVKVFEPKHVAKRVSAQHSFFTIHGSPQDDLYSELKDYKKIYINTAGENVVTLRAALDRLGINEGSIYNDLDGLAKHIVWLNSFAEDE